MEARTGKYPTANLLPFEDSFEFFSSLGDAARTALVRKFTQEGKQSKVGARGGLKLSIAIIDHDRQTERRGVTHVFRMSLQQWRSLSRGGRYVP